MRKVNFDSKQTATLNTAWKFYFEEFIPPSAIHQTQPTLLLAVPNTWGGAAFGSGVLPDQGYGTYALQVLLPQTKAPLSLHVPEMATAYKLYINGKLYAQAGKIGRSKNESVPETKPQIVELGSNLGEKMDIVFHISNFHHKKSGLWDTITIGTAQKIKTKERRAYFIAIFLSGAILIIGLYHVGLFFLRLKDRSTFYFSLFAIAIVLRLMSTGEMLILDIFPSLNWEWRLTLDHISMYLALGFGYMYSHQLFPDEVKRIPTNVIFAFSILFTLACVFTSGVINSYFVIYYQIIILLVVVYLCVTIFLSVRNKREGAIAYATGYLIIVLAVTNDVLYSLNLLPTFYITPVGVFFFFFSQSVVLSIRSAKAFNAVEKLSKELQAVNVELEQKVIRRTETIAKKHEELQKINLNLQEREAELEEKASDLEQVNQELKAVQAKNEEALQKEIEINQQLEETLRKLSEAQDYLIQSDKMASLGQLTAGIAHEINNPINFIAVGVDCIEPLLEDVMKVLNQYALLDSAKEDELQGLLEQTKQLKKELEIDEIKEEVMVLLSDVKIGVTRTIEIINGLRNFSRGEKGKEAKPADIHQCIDSCLLMLKNKYKHRIELSTSYDESIPLVVCKVGQIHQVLLNLIANAIQAIEGKGEIWIQTHKLDDEKIAIQIKDSGKGIASTDLHKIFDPFFTTKEAGEGTGLGLSISHGIIADHGGTIEVESEVGKGTRFTITLPVNGGLKIA
ncbi:MAG: ATP-binding protein [Flammeovirgaceae bacterium]